MCRAVATELVYSSVISYPEMLMGKRNFLISRTVHKPTFICIMTKKETQKNPNNNKIALLRKNPNTLEFF